MKKFAVYQTSVWWGVPDELLRVYNTREEAERYAHGMIIDMGKIVKEIEVPDDEEDDEK